MNKCSHGIRDDDPCPKCLKITKDPNKTIFGSVGSVPLDVQIGGSHYKDMKIQPVEYSEGNNLSFLEGSVVKRVTRHSRGGKGREDIEKAIHELQLILQLHYPNEAEEEDFVLLTSEQ